MAVLGLSERADGGCGDRRAVAASGDNAASPRGMLGTGEGVDAPRCRAQLLPGASLRSALLCFLWRVWLGSWRGGAQGRQERVGAEPLLPPEPQPVAPGWLGSSLLCARSQ